ncbi:MAG: transporter substrate-binding protein [Paucimonas sp.]|nr:transporter substrate-binding protein [Paucimonas sp.]
MQYRKYLGFALVLASIIGAQPALAQAWPNAKPVVFINPFPPGGAVDAFGRPLAQVLSNQIGAPIVVENKSGAGGTVGAALAAKMAPDGYTWLLGAIHHTIAPSIYPRLQYDIERDFEPVALIADVPHVIVVNPRKVPETDLKSLTERLKKPNKVDYASTGTGTSQHLTGELFKLKTGAQINHVPYRGTGPALQDLVAGHVDMMFDTLAGAGGFIKSGQLRALAVTTNERVTGYEAVPTTREAGMPDFVATSWYAMWAVKGTPKPVVDRMIAEVNKALASPDIQAKWTTMGATTRKLNGPEFGSFVHGEVARWADVVKRANVKVE